MLFVLSGELRTYLLSEEGREVTLFRLYPGELCVLSASCVISQITFDTQLSAGADTEVLVIPANIVDALAAQNLHLRCFLYESHAGGTGKPRRTAGRGDQKSDRKKLIKQTPQGLLL